MKEEDGGSEILEAPNFSPRLDDLLNLSVYPFRYRIVIPRENSS